MMYVSQIIMLYTLNLYSAVCQLYVSKAGRRKKNSFHKLSTYKSKHLFLTQGSVG